MNSDTWSERSTVSTARPDATPDTPAGPGPTGPDGGQNTAQRPTALRRRTVWIRRLIPLGVVVAAGVAVAVIATLEPREDNAPVVDIPPVNVTIQTVKPIPELTDSFRLTAVVEANRVVAVAAEVAGRVERYARRDRAVEWGGRVIPAGAELDEGQPISAGEPIVYLNDAVLKARYERARAQKEFDDIEFERISELYRQGTASKTELDDRRTKRDVSNAAADEALEELQRAVVAAPVTGVLNCLPMEVGEYATPGLQVAEIVDLRTVKIVVYVPERDVHYLQVGEPATVLIRNPVRDERIGTITYISELSDESTRTTRVEITIDNADRSLRSGQLVQARLDRRTLQDVIMVPLGAVIPLETEKAVYVVDDEDRAERRTVELGFLKERSVRILSGLEAGDRLIVAGHRYVGPGQRVAIREEW
jgi:membrane fusion protein (multidrug efflux system)